jgi:hypothetical protein
VQIRDSLMLVAKPFSKPSDMVYAARIVHSSSSQKANIGTNLMFQGVRNVALELSLSLDRLSSTKK